MAVKRWRFVSVLLVLGAASWQSACGTRYADIITRANDARGGDDTSVPSNTAAEGGMAGAGGVNEGEVGGDPCPALGADACALDTAHGCSLQPNPTGCLSSDLSCGPGSCAGGDPFVRRVGEALFLRGVPYTFVGTVSWGIAWADGGGCKVNGFSSQEQADSAIIDQLASMHVSVLRFWAFQKYAGTSGTDYSHFDLLVKKARAAGIRLLPVLENIGADCSVSPARDDTWFAGGYKSPYGGYTLSYREYVAGVVAHFREEPTILGWELFHEAGGNDFAAFDAFSSDMTQLVRDIDSNHLIAVGLNTGDSKATSSDPTSGADITTSNYYKLQNHDEVDLIDLQDFNHPDQALPAQSVACAEIARALDKVAFVGASAIKLPDKSAAAFQTRADQFESKLTAALDASVRGFLVYDFIPDWSSVGYDFDTRADEPLAGPDGVLERHAPRYGRASP